MQGRAANSEGTGGDSQGGAETSVEGGGPVGSREPGCAAVFSGSCAIKKQFTNWLRRYALRTGRLAFLYRKLCRPDGAEYAEFMRRHGKLRHIGENCSILMS